MSIDRLSETRSSSIETRPYRVLLVNLAKGFGGAETRVYSQAQALQGAVEQCGVAVVHESPLHRRLRASGVNCEPISASRSDPRSLLQLWRVIRAGRYDIVDAHNIQSVFWGHLAALLAGVRGRVTTVHSNYAEEYTGIRRIGYSAVSRIMRGITSQFVQVTGLLHDQAQSARYGRRSTVISNAVPVPENPPERKDPSVVAEWGWTADNFVVATVGRLFPVKGQSYLIDAMVHLQDLHHVRLLLVGDGPLRPELEATVASLGLAPRVHFTGFRQDVSQVLRGVDCVCLPSLWEVLPYAALEAAAFARPVVATAVGGIPDVFRDGETALLVPAQDGRALASALRYLAASPGEARRLGRAAYEMVRSSFSTDDLLRKTLQVYDRALA
jgi:glycosyltransferase involved in cell wall biosynthesis